MGYSPERKSTVLKRMLPPNNLAIRQLSQEGRDFRGHTAQVASRRAQQGAASAYKCPMHHARGAATLRANKRETFDWLKFTLEGEGERTHGYAFTDTAFARYRV